MFTRGVERGATRLTLHYLSRIYRVLVEPHSSGVCALSWTTSSGVLRGQWTRLKLLISQLIAAHTFSKIENVVKAYVVVYDTFMGEYLFGVDWKNNFWKVMKSLNQHFFRRCA